MAIIVDYVVFALFAALFADLALIEIAWNLGIAAAVLIFGLALFAAGVFGGGDAKLLASSVVWFGLPGLVRYVFLIALAGGLLAVVILGLQKVTPKGEWSRWRWLNNLCSGRHGLPYGVAIAIASGLMFSPLLAQVGS